MLNNKGVALIVSLFVALIILVLGGMALYVSMESTKISGGFKQYRSSIEAAIGAYNETDKIIMSLNIVNSTITYPDSLVDKNISCLKSKLKTPVDQWNEIADNANGDGCPSVSKMRSTKVDDIMQYYDLKYKIGDYNVYVKVVSSTKGNTSNVSGNGRTVGGTTANKKGGNTNISRAKYLYRVEIVSISSVNNNDKTLISLLYGY